MKANVAAHVLALATTTLLGGCIAMDEDLEVAVESTMAPLLGAGDVDVIPGQYIVVWKESVAAQGTDQALKRLALQSAESRVEHTFTIVPGFSARLTAEDLAAVRRNPDVAYVEADRVIRAAATSPAPGEQDLDRHDHCPVEDDGVFNDNGCNGSSVLVYVIGTGIRATHSEFVGRVNTARGFTAISDGRGVNDCNGQGTYMASLAAGVRFGLAKGATLVPVRVLGCTGTGTNTGVINGINHIANNCGTTERCVASFGLSGSASTTLESALANAISRGITFSVPAGDSNQDANNASPGRVPSALTVGCAVDPTSPAPPGQIARCAGSNFGPRVDVWASGQSILGAGSGSDSGTQVGNGTAPASAYVAGAVAQMLSCQGRLTAAQVEAQLDGKAIPDIMSDILGAQNLYLCSDFNDGDGNACACTGGALLAE